MAQHASRPNRVSNFNLLRADLKLEEAHELDRAAGKPGLTASEVALLEAKRNRVAAHAARIRRGDA